jgi:hypothetical protein
LFKMPLELTNIDVYRKNLSADDKGFIVSVAKSRWTKNSSVEAMDLLNSFAQAYYEEKCPESQPVATEEPKDEQAEESEEKGEEKPAQTHDSNEVTKANNSGILFAHRKQAFTNCGFIASNLADPADFAYYIMNQFAGAKKDVKTKFPFRIMPVQAICEARPKAVEKAAMPLIQSIFGKDDEPYRFSMMYRGKGDGDYLTQQEAKALIRNCIWSVNPNCVQCIKYQDYAIIVDILNPHFCIGIAKDFQKLAGYNTRAVRLGLDLTDLGEDSEDDISDDPTLDEESEKRRKLRIKRKRRAEKAGMNQPEGESKASRGGEEGDEEDEEGHGNDLEMEEEHEENEAAEETENGV